MAGSNISEQQPCLSSPSKTSGKVAEEGQQPGLLILVPLTLGVGKVCQWVLRSSKLLLQMLVTFDWVPALLASVQRRVTVIGHMSLV